MHDSLYVKNIESFSSFFSNDNLPQQFLFFTVGQLLRLSIFPVSSCRETHRFNYYLTEKGIDLLPTITELMIWGIKYNAMTKNTSLKIWEKI